MIASCRARSSTRQARPPNARPVPWVGYTALTMPEEYMVSDQRFAATRPDVLVYVTEPLEEDLTIVGPVSPRLFVSTTGTDSDWVVKLIDVYPEKNPSDWKHAGYQLMVANEVLRGRYRTHPDRPEPVRPGWISTLRVRPPTGMSIRIFSMISS